MPGKLTFSTSKEFRDKILARTLPVQNGPMSQTENTYRLDILSDMSNIDQLPVDGNLSLEDGTIIIHDTKLVQTPSINLYKPDTYFIKDELSTLPRRANLALYPYFTSGDHTIIGIMTTDNFNTESELFKFASAYMKSDIGPFQARVQQNLETTTVGRIRLIDALEGNLATATNIVTGKEPLIEANNKITVSRTLPGKGIDFFQTVLGVEFPWVEIPGDYLTNPENPIVNRPNARTPLGQLNQDITGALGSLIGIQRRPTLNQKPSDLFIEYLGSGQRQNLYDNLSYSKYAPNYTVAARSQQSSKVFNFVDSLGQNINKFFGADAPDTIAYIGDDRGNDAKYSMSDFYDRPVRSPYYLTLLFDPIQGRLFQRERNLSENGPIGGKLTWISSKSKNKLGDGNTEWAYQKGGFDDTRSTNYPFRNDSLLGLTQEILETLPTNGSEMRSHVANVIDQTSRIFKDGDIVMSRGSAIKYVDKFGLESGVEYCRAWTKDRSYLNYSDTMKRTGNVRKFDGSVMSTPWNLNIAPMSNGNKSFDGSTNMAKKGDGFYAKKYMFSIENLAWKTSNVPGFTYNDLPYCERGNNGGRVMWFPPYDLKVTEQNSAKWEANTFLGRPEPIYTYQNTERNGTLSFKVIVDHPSVLNLLVREHFKGMSDEESENYINAFFAGCEEIDFYDLIRRYTTLTPEDAKMITDYIEKGKDPETIKKNSYLLDRQQQNEPSIIDNNEEVKLNVSLKFLNDTPSKGGGGDYKSPSDYSAYYLGVSDPSLHSKSMTTLTQIINTLIPFTTASSSYTEKDRNNDVVTLFNRTVIDPSEKPTLILEQSKTLQKTLDDVVTDYSSYSTQIQNIKNDILNDVVTEVKIHLLSTTSAVADDGYNFYLSLRRSHSILKEILSKVSNVPPLDDKWVYTDNTDIQIEFTFNELGFKDKTGKIIFSTKSVGESYALQENTRCGLYDFIDPELRKVAPIAYECRQTQVIFVYTKKNQTQINKPESDANTITIITPTNDGTNNNTGSRRSQPPIDVMKSIVMKTLSECYYFKKLEETDPVIFGSLKEKFKYFHPSFHSTTPEGLNSRLTFLLQCVRPGDTIPIKGVNSSLDTRARNTSFGPPPICVLRVGDFYHSKVVIRDVNIDFEENLWDLNPEGIGIQPMIANITIQLSFIGGQGLEKPVNWLQNALTSNFYANTEMYDPRSISTNETMNGMKQADFTKEFLQSLMEDNGKKPTYNEPDNINKIKTGTYIGTVEAGTINYSSVLTDIFDTTKSYVTNYPNLYNEITKVYGNNVSSILLSSKYRKNDTYNVFSASSINLLGLYEKGSDLFLITQILQNKLTTSLNNIDVLEMFGFTKVIPENKKPKAIVFLTEYLNTFITDTTDNMNSDQNLISIELLRNDLIAALDKGNFINEYEYDAKLNENKIDVTTATFPGLTSIYSGYSTCIDYIIKNTPQFTEDLDLSLNYDNAIESISDNDFTEIMSSLLSTVDSKEFISKTFGRDTVLFDSTLNAKLEEKFLKFIKVTDSKTFKLTKFIERGEQVVVKYEILNETPLTDPVAIDKITKINKTSNIPINELNYYRA